MSNQFTTALLEGFLDEALPDHEMTAIETALREEPALAERLANLVGQRDAGVHTLGAIWRRHRLTCPSREQLGSHLLEVLAPEQAEYVRFHLESVGCRYCRASLDDLRQQHAATDLEDSRSRQKRYFQSSAGYLSKDE